MKLHCPSTVGATPLRSILSSLRQPPIIPRRAIPVKLRGAVDLKVIPVLACVLASGRGAEALKLASAGGRIVRSVVASGSEKTPLGPWGVAVHNRNIRQPPYGNKSRGGVLSGTFGFVACRAARLCASATLTKHTDDSVEHHWARNLAVTSVTSIWGHVFTTSRMLDNWLNPRLDSGR